MAMLIEERNDIKTAVQDAASGPVKVLISDTAPLYPPLWGGPRRIWGIFSQFSRKKYEFTYVGLNQNIKTTREERQIEPGFREILFSFPEIVRAYWKPVHELLFTGLSFDLLTYFFPALASGYAEELRSSEADVLVTSHPWAASFFKKKPHQFFIYDAHNCEYLLMKALSKGHLFGPLLTRWTRWIEAVACRKSDLILVCSEEDKQAFKKFYRVAEDKLVLVPNGTSVPELPLLNEKKSAKKSTGLVKKWVAIFIGAYYKPNNEAAEFIVYSLAPAAREVTFLIVGSVNDHFRDKEVPPNVIFTGFVPDESLREYLLAADVAINPVKSGSGVNIKMLDYLAYGLPTITTNCGARGLEFEKSGEILVCERSEFEKTLKRLSAGEWVDWQRKIIASRNQIAEKYDWGNIGRKFEADLLSKIRIA